MTAHDLLAELDRRGIAIQAHGDRLRYAPRSAVTPELAARMRQHKRALLAILGDANEANWHAVSLADYDYLTGPRRHPRPCPWCGGRLVHNPACDDLRQGWVPTIPFGKHRGRRVDQLPADYVGWILAAEVGGAEFRDQLRRWLAAEGRP
ncbi:MAG: hypothetical protein CMJ58_05350 [Planctomycetaceae bacterium]|nr:hypothetical protein [Planctomycetaceae bacterium]